jgi:hypothetical protein
MTSQVESNEGAVATLKTKEVWETPRVTSAAVSEITKGGPTRGIETGGDIGPS